jgi:hypothetical protein
VYPTWPERREALAEGWIAGAALDDIEEEPAKQRDAGRPGTIVQPCRYQADHRYLRRLLVQARLSTGSSILPISLHKRRLFFQLHGLCEPPIRESRLFQIPIPHPGLATFATQ